MPYYRQIVDQVIYGVANGLLKPGDQLPTVRRLAVDLKVNLNTIAKAYNELELRGIVNTQQGTGTFISERKAEFSPEERKNALENICASFLDQVAAIGVSTKDAISTLKKIENDRICREKRS